MRHMNNQEGKDKVVFHDRYLLIQQLGKGGFSTVWKAKDKMSDIIVAIKIFLKQDVDGIELCREEFRKTHDLKHPNILRPFHFDVYEGQPYIVMPFLSGGTLDKLVGIINIDQFQKLYTQISSAINYLHASDRQIIHGDIKPDNILQDKAGNFYLTDFGISQRLENSFTMTLGADQIYADSYSSKGITPIAFRAPEHFSFKNWKMSGSLPASDIWAFGVSLHQLIQGELIFSGEGGLGQLVMMSSGEFPLNEIVTIKEAFKSYEQHILQCLRLNPQERKMMPLIADDKQGASMPLKVTKPKLQTKGTAGFKETQVNSQSSYLKIPLVIMSLLVISVIGLGLFMTQETEPIVIEAEDQAVHLEYFQSNMEEDENYSIVDDTLSTIKQEVLRADIVLDEDNVDQSIVVAEESNGTTTKKKNIETNYQQKGSEEFKQEILAINTVNQMPEPVPFAKGQNSKSILDEKVIHIDEGQEVEEFKEEISLKENQALKANDLEPTIEKITNRESKNENLKVNDLLNKIYVIKLKPEQNVACADDLKKGQEVSFLVAEALIVQGQQVFTPGQAINGKITQFKCSGKGVLQNINISFKNHVLLDGSIMRFRNLQLYLKNKNNEIDFMISEDQTYDLEFVGRNEYDFKKFVYALYEEKH